MSAKSGKMRVCVEWGYDTHEVVLTPRNWSRIKRGNPLRIRTQSWYEGGSQWEYWNFSGGLEGDLVVEYGEDGGVGFDGKLSDATIDGRGNI